MQIQKIILKSLKAKDKVSKNWLNFRHLTSSSKNSKAPEISKSEKF